MSIRTATILKAGMHTAIQDTGRFGYRKYGVPLSGAMDTQSMHRANLLAGNPTTNPVLECTMIGPTLLFHADALAAISGASCKASLNNQAIPTDMPLRISKGDTLEVGRCTQGTRAYLAIHGLQAPYVLGSASQYNGVTPIPKMENGGIISYVSYRHSDGHCRVKAQDFTRGTLMVFPGPEFEKLPDRLANIITTEAFSVGNNNRMGYQMNNHKLNRGNGDILTAPVIPGTVQLTPSGTLYVLMKDAQVTGGYPRILQLDDQSISLLAQKKQGEKVQFQVLQ